MGTATTQIIISGKDELSRVVADAGRRLGTELQSMQRHVFGLQAALGALGVGAAFAQVRSLSNEWESALTDMGKVTSESMASITARMSDMPAELGSMTELVRGYYQTISAGVTDPARALDTLTTAAESAKAAHMDQSEVIKALTKTMAGYAGDITSASDAADLLFAIEKQGQTSFQELVPIIGDVSSISKEVAVNQHEMGAALAAVTQTAGGTSQAGTQYRAMLTSLLKPTEKMEIALDALGVSSGKQAVEMFGLAGTLQRLQQYSEQSGVGLGKLFESSEALLAVAALSRQEFAQYNTNLDAMTAKAGAADKAFEHWRQTGEATDAVMRNALANTLILIGHEVMPTVNREVLKFAGLLDNNKKGVSEWSKALKYEFLDVTQVVQGMSVVLHGTGAAADAVGMGLYGVGAALGNENSQRGFDYFAKAYEENTAAVASAQKEIVRLQGEQEAIYKATAASVSSATPGSPTSNPSPATSTADISVPATKTTSAANEAARAVASMQSEIARLTMTASDFERYELGLKFDEYSKSLGRANPLLQEWVKLRQDEISLNAVNAELADYFGDIDKRAAELLTKAKSDQEKNEEILLDFSDRYREIVVGETEFKKEQIDRQAEIFRSAGAVDIAVAQWVAQEKLAISRDWQDGATRALQSYTDEADNAAKNVEDVMGMAFTGMEDMIVDFVKTGKLEFADLVTSINAEIARLAFRSMASDGYEWLGGVIKAGLSMASSYLSGGVSEAAGSARGGFNYAGELSHFMSVNALGGVYDSPSLSAYSGGVYHTPQMFAFARGAGIFAEAGPEAIMPLRRGPDGVLGVKSGGGDEKTYALLSEIAESLKRQKAPKTVVAFDKRTLANELAGSEGEQLVFQHIRRNPAAVRRMLGLG
ncbi:phage tail tape measure protein [Desulfomicrobium salsuginis]